MKKPYEKPRMEINDFRLNNAVANTCWGLTQSHPNQTTRYYDVTGDGIVSFNVTNTDGSCSAPSSYSIQYITRDSETDELVCKDGSAYKTELDYALSLKGGNNGQPYNGIDADFPSHIIPDSQ